MALQDLSSGLGPDKERIIQTEPTEPFWSENILFALYDPGHDVGMWLHLGTVPNDWTLWEDRIYVTLPDGGGVLHMASHHETAPELRPGGASLHFRCVEPFRRWAVRFNGFAQHTSEASMEAGDHVSYRRRLRLELEIECTTPAWDAERATSGRGGGMQAQGWAKEHYEQLFRATGAMWLAGEKTPILASGWRDHSRGPRGGPAGEPWGGHVIGGCQFPSGRAAIFSQYWRPDGVINLSGGAVVDREGRFHLAEVVNAPRLTDLRLRGERLPVRLRWPGGELSAVLLTHSSVWIPRERKHAVGRDRVGRLGDMYVLNWGPMDWDGEVGHAYVERSAHLNNLPRDVGPVANAVEAAG